MLSTATTPNPAALVRNYAIAAAAIALLSLGAADAFNNTTRVGQQGRLDQYGRAISAGLVGYARTSLR